MILLILILLFIFILILKVNNKLIYVKSNIDNKYYLVNNLPNSKKAADILAYLYITANTLINKILDEGIDVDNNYEFHNYILNIKKKILNLIIQESGLYDKNNTYSINKGEKIVICLRNKITLEIYDSNLLVYVIIHEISHIGCPEVGHSALFYQINKYLLIKAIKFNLYKYENYNNIIYCGIDITSSILDG